MDSELYYQAEAGIPFADYYMHTVYIDHFPLIRIVVYIGKERYYYMITPYQNHLFTRGV